MGIENIGKYMREPLVAAQVKQRNLMLSFFKLNNYAWSIQSKRLQSDTKKISTDRAANDLSLRQETFQEFRALVYFPMKWAIGMKSYGIIPCLSCEPKESVGRNPLEVEFYEIPLPILQIRRGP